MSNTPTHISSSPQQAQHCFHSLAKALLPKLRYFVAKRVADSSVREDIVQQTLLEGHRNWHKFRGDSSAATWLFGIASNLSKNAVMKAYKRESILEPISEFIESTVSSPLEDELESRLSRHQVLKLLNARITQLTPQMQDVLTHVLIEGMSYEEAALELNLPVGTVRSRLSRARSALKESLSSDQLG